MMRVRTVWDWRLRIYPLIVIPWIVYVAAQEKVSAIQSSVPGVVPVAAAPLHGFHQGRAIVCERRPMITFCFEPTSERR